MTRLNPKKLKFHPDSDRIPPMGVEEYTAFLEDVRHRGVRDPVEVLPGTMIVVEGRNRLRAALEAGLPDVPVKDAELLPGETPYLYMLRKAILRRNLPAGALAALAAELIREAGGRGPRAGVPVISQGSAAASAGVGRRAVQAAAVVLERGTPEEVEAVRRGQAAPTRVEADIRRKEREIRAKATADPARFAPFAARLDARERVGDVYRDFCRERDCPTRPDVLLDGTGYPVPAALRPLFRDRWLTDTAAGVGAMVDGLKATVEKVRRQGPGYRHLDHRGALKALAVAEHGLQAAQSLLVAGSPHAVHQKCKGEGCRTCRKAGWMPK